MAAPRFFENQVQEKADFPRMEKGQPVSSPDGPFLRYSSHST
jgi:hypothetical protein